MKVLGMKKEIFGDSVYEQDGKGGLTSKPVENERHYLYLIDSGVFYELSLEVNSQPCNYYLEVVEEGSFKLKEISDLPSNILHSKIDKEFDMVDTNKSYYSCDVFEFSTYGSGDKYYPYAQYSVNESLFQKL